MPIKPVKIIEGKLIAAIIMSTCIVLVVYVLLSVTAGFLVLHPRHMMMQWQLGSQDLSAESWKSAVSSVELAAKLDQLNNEYIYDLGRLHEWRALQGPIWSETSRMYRSQAILYYRTALQYQSVWPQAWIQLAENKVLNQGFDAEVIHALTLALEYGSWEYGVHKKLIWLGIATWDHLPEKTKDKVRNLIVDSLKNHRNVDYINNTAKYFNWDEHLNIPVTNEIPSSRENHE